jgi:hypothetical protein
MTNFLQWRKMTWTLVLWTGYIATWAVVTGSGPAMIALWWLAGTILLGSLWLATRPLVQQGRGLAGVFLKPSWGQWRVVNLHRVYPAPTDAEARDAC